MNDERSSTNIATEFFSRCRTLKLIPHTGEKCFQQPITSKFDFLGYSFNEKIISVRDGSVDGIRRKIINLCTAYKYRKDKDLEKLIFKVNLKISGCIFNGKKFGWLFYFSQINDKSLLHGLDHFVSKQLKRVGITSISQVKSFHKTWYQINYNLETSKYIPNFDTYSQEKKIELVALYKFRRNPENLDGDFRRIIIREIRDLENDLGSFS
jgi:hypothetical protein